MSVVLRPTRRRRAMSLTPMIDVVFLLLVFFMLAARFDQTTVVPVEVTGAGSDYTGPPRLIDVTSDSLLLNGVRTNEADLVAALQNLMESPDDLVVIRSRGDADVQRLVDILGLLSEQGFTALTLVE